MVTKLYKHSIKVHLRKAVHATITQERATVSI